MEFFTITVNGNKVAQTKSSFEAYGIWWRLVKEYLQYPQDEIFSEDTLENGQEINRLKGCFADNAEEYSIEIDYNRHATYELKLRGQSFYIPLDEIEQKCQELYEEGESFKVYADDEEVTDLIEF